VKALLLDVGNTRLKWGVLEDDQIHRTGHIAMRKVREEGLGVLTSRLPRSVDAVHVSNGPEQLSGPGCPASSACIANAMCTSQNPSGLPVVFRAATATRGGLASTAGWQ